LCDLENLQDKTSQVLSKITTNSDSGAYLLRKGIVLLQNIDFITPLLNDPFQFGAIAAANALSDVYSMGGRPITALNMLCFPTENIETKIANSILKGGLSKIREAGAHLLGGHTIDSEELIYGLSVTGVVSEKKIVKNTGAKKGDHLVLSKPIGNTLIVNSHARLAHNAIDVSNVNLAIESMMMLNLYVSKAMNKIGVNACTDVTGFGFLGHLWELCSSSGVGAIIDTNAIPVASGVIDIVSSGYKSSARERNYQHLKQENALDGNCQESLFHTICEAETSGGLLISVPPEKSIALVKKINGNHAHECAYVIGEIIKGPPKIYLK
jgi:selenide, water dikinase